VTSSLSDYQITRRRVTYAITVRVFLLTSIALANGNRSVRALATVTLQQFEEARFVDDRYVVSVCDYKTAASCGPAKLVLTHMLHSWMRIYAYHIRPNMISQSNVKAEMHIFYPNTNVQLADLMCHRI